MPSGSNFMSEANKVGTHGRASVVQNRNASPINSGTSTGSATDIESSIHRFTDYSHSFINTSPIRQ